MQIGQQTRKPGRCSGSGGSGGRYSGRRGGGGARWHGSGGRGGRNSCSGYGGNPGYAQALGTVVVWGLPTTKVHAQARLWEEIWRWATV